MATLVTGAGGFLGKLLVKQLLQEGTEVRAMVHHIDKGALREQEGLTIIEGEIEDQQSIRKCMEGCERVYHLAALATPWVKDHNLYHRVNVEGTSNLLQVAEECGVDKVIHTSSAGTLGPQKGADLVTEEQRLAAEDALTFYEITKIKAEERVQQAVHEGKVDAVIVNPTRLQGPGPIRASNGVTKMIKGYLNATWRIIPGDGKRLGNYVYTEDVIRGMTQAMEHGRPGERYLLGGPNLTFNELFDMIAKVSGHHTRMIRIPAFLLISTALGMQGWAALTGKAPLITSGWVRKYLMNDWGADISKAEKELGYAPHSAEEGIQKTYEWLVKEGHVSSGTRESSQALEGPS
ncbi:MAG: NAD-dependent epimerase/dehydratase family protein [Flavobacteriales bacterium]